MITLAIVATILVAGSAATDLVDPATDPSGFVTQLIGFWHTNPFIAVGLGLYALLEMLAAVGKKFPNVARLAWLGTGRVSLVIAGATATLGAILHAALGGGTTQAALFAGLGAYLAWAHPAAEDVAKK